LQRYNEILEQLLVFNNLDKVNIRMQVEQEQLKEKMLRVAQEENLEDSLNAIVFTISRKQTFLIIRSLYRVAFGNIYYETHQFE
jgi:hypothetical protein